MTEATAIPAPTPPSALSTSFVTSLGILIAGLLVEWAKTKGIVLTDAQQTVFTTSGGIAIGSATEWVLAILDSFAAAVIALNNAVANRATAIINKIGGLS